MSFLVRRKEDTVLFLDHQNSSAFVRRGHRRIVGGVLAVVNRQIGIGTYSPWLDRYGNSVGGTEGCTDLASRLGLHVFGCVNVGSNFLDTVL